jgi:acyl carrier protein
MNTDLVHRIRDAVETVAFRKVQADEPLLSSQLIDSIGVVDLVVNLEKEFKVAIDINSISETNFNTVQDIARFIEGKLS